MTGQIAKDPGIIVKLRDILEKNLGNEHFGVKELSRSVGLSRSSLHRKVHAYNGNSTSQFIREFRLQKAMELLQNEELTVSEIAYSVGFSSPTYFNTCFKEYYGYPPGEAKSRIVPHHADDKMIPGQDRKVFKKWIVVLSILVVVISALATTYYINTQNDKRTAISKNDGENSIAVLPFKNWSGDAGLEYISDGMTDAVITKLSVFESLKVIPFNSVLKYKSSVQDAPTIARELGVQNILQGNYQLSGDQVKITLHLIHGPSNTNVSSKVYTGEWKMEQIFKMQASVVEDLVSQLQINTSSEELLAIERIPTENKEAYNSWLKAKYQALKYTKAGMANAIPLFEQAIELDPNFVEPYVDLAQLYLLGGASWGLYSEREAWNIAKKLLTKALEINDSYQDAKDVLNDGLYIYEWDFKNMEKNFRTNSNLKITYCIQTGRHEEALALNEELYKKYPTSFFLITSKAFTLFLLNRSEEARVLLNSSDNLYSDHIMYLRIASRVYFYLQEYESSYRLLNIFLDNYPERPATVLWILAACEYKKGNLQAAENYITEIKSIYEKGASGSPAWFTALYYTSIGNHENAFKWLQYSFDRHEVEMIWLREEPALKPLRSDPRYVELYHKVGFPMPPYPN